MGSLSLLVGWGGGSVDATGAVGTIVSNATDIPLSHPQPLAPLLPLPSKRA